MDVPEINEDSLLSSASTLDKPSFDALLQRLGDAYHNDESLVRDEIYDDLIEIYTSKYGPYYTVGAEPTGEKVPLPYYLASLRKVKEESELTRWTNSYPGPYIIQDKIDGLTLLYTSIGGRKSMYTRGNGNVGVDVSHLVPYLRLPDVRGDIAIRGEIVLTKDAFARVGAGFKNARNLASGVVNSKKSFNPALASELSFYAYRILTRQNTPQRDAQELIKMGFLVPNPLTAPGANMEVLTNHLKSRIRDAPYEVDGLVIYQNTYVEYPTNDDPRHIVAFKIGTEKATTIVNSVEWESSKNGLLKPVVHYQTVNLSGADLSKASGYNAKFIVSNNIGPGAKILITRSGDVIPKILLVITPAPGGPSYPDPSVHGQYKWNDNQVEFELLADNSEVLTNKLVHFITTLGVKQVGKERMRVLVNNGITTPSELLNANVASLVIMGPTISEKLYSDLRAAITNVSIPKLMDASGIFNNIGERRFEAIFEAYPNFLDFAYSDPAAIAIEIRKVKGFKSLAEVIAPKVRTFVEWVRLHPQIRLRYSNFVAPVSSVPSSSVPSGSVPSVTTPTGTLSGITVVFSGFRDKNLEERIKAAGGKVTTAVSKNTTMLILKSLSSENMSGKVLAAQEKGVRLISRSDFESTYLNI